MEDNRNFETQNEEQESQQGEKRYTQAEVEEIIKRRLARERRKAGQSTGNDTQGDDRESTLAQRELMITAKERLMEEGLPTSLVSVLRFTNEDELDTAIEVIENVKLKSGSQDSWGQRQKNSGKPDQIRKAMGLDRK